MANLIVCCDGTWNTPNQEDNGQPAPTNVFKLHSACADSDLNDIPQKAFYRPGVGSSGTWAHRLLGGGLGKGLDNDIKSAYKWLCDTYQDGDQIYMFGFSRGAYSVRSLAGLMGRCQLLNFHDQTLPEAQKWKQVDAAYNNYRSKNPNDSWHQSLTRHSGVKIKFLGVWDTVGALGIPDEIPLTLLRRNGRYMFHDTELGDSVEHARHALAIDEKRRTFSPTFWSKHQDSSEVKQIWFSGVHSDVGGGYAHNGLSDITLEWMMDEASEAGLAFREGANQHLAPDPQGALHNSVKGIYAKMRTRPRNVPHISDANTMEVHPSVFKRQANPPLSQPHYWPARILESDQSILCNIYAKDHWNATGIFLEAGQEYNFSAQGEWLDASITCGPDGPQHFQAGMLAYAIAAAPNWLQRKRRKDSDNSGAIAAGAKREQDMPWFSLIGVIANGQGVDTETQILNPHESFNIGSGLTYVPKTSGYFYCFANDIWSFYWNNKGSLQLTVKRI